MAEFVGGEPISVDVDEPITFENKTDTAFDVSCGIVFHKSGLYRVSIVGSHVSVAVEPERETVEEIKAQPEPCEDAVSKIKNASFTGSDGLDYVETLVALDALKLANSSSAQPEYEELTPEEAASEIASGSTISAWYWNEVMTRIKQMGYEICRKKALETIEALPSVTPKEQRWIPVSERLPSGQTEVIVSCHDDSGDTSFDYSACGWVTNDGEYWIADNEINNFVIAWMPLPEPYREG